MVRSFIVLSSQLFRKIANFPIVNDSRVLGLLERYNERIMALTAKIQTLKDVQGGEATAELSAQLFKLHDLEARIIRSEEEKVETLKVGINGSVLTSEGEGEAFRREGQAEE